MTSRAFVVAMWCSSAAALAALPPPPPGCTMTQSASCAGLGGSLTVISGRCACEVVSWVPRQVTNAQKGDVALVPLDVLTQPADQAIKTVMGALVQNFSHSLIFASQNQVVHNTMVEELFAQLISLVGGVGISPSQLMNGSPGFVSTTLDWAHDHDRLGDEGLIAKPASEAQRPDFELAAQGDRILIWAVASESDRLASPEPVHRA